MENRDLYKMVREKLKEAQDNLMYAICYWDAHFRGYDGKETNEKFKKVFEELINIGEQTEYEFTRTSKHYLKLYKDSAEKLSLFEGNFPIKDLVAKGMLSIVTSELMDIDDKLRGE